MSKNYFDWLIVLLVAVLLNTACKTYFPAQETSTLIKIDKNFTSDSGILNFYQPFKDSLDKMMKVPLAELAEDLSKKMPESTLGNLMTDILKTKATDYTKSNIDAAILNYGGIRMGSLSKGKLNIEHAYLLMPFDNYIVVQVVTGQQLNAFCDSMALKGGWPVSGITFKIKNKKAVQIQVNNQEINLNGTYRLATNDYVANGGDGMSFLKNIPQIQTGKLFRDAIIEYWTEQSKAGNKITSRLENRITYAD